MKTFIASIFIILLSLPLYAQTLTHPEKVYINPASAAPADALKVDGGIKAGANGSVQVVNADGTISASATIGDGTIQKIKLGNDCTNGQVLLRNNSGSAPYWDCGTSAGINAGDNNVTITGTGWRFSNALTFGSSTTAQEQIHIYNSAGDVGLQIQNNSQSWKLRTSSTSLRFANGATYPISMTSTQVGIFNTSPTAGYELDVTGDVRVSGNTLFLGSFGNHIYPATSDTYDLGTYTAKWRNLFTSSLLVDQFIQQNIQVYNGYQIIGKSSGSFNSAVSNSATSFISDESHTVGDFILVRGRDASGNFQTEYMKLLNKTGVGPYTYDITAGSGGRNLDGSGANSWNAETSYLVLGKEYDGRLEFYANTGIPTIRTVIQGNTYSAFTSLVHIGGLDGITGVTAARYGLYVGKNDGTGDYLKFQNSLASPTGDDGKLKVKGTIEAGSFLVSSSAISLAAGGLNVGTSGAVWGGRTAYSDTNAGFWFGYDGAYYKGYLGNNSNYVRWTGTQLEVAGSIAVTGTFTGVNYATSSSPGGNATLANDTVAVNGTAAATVSGGAARANAGLDADGDVQRVLSGTNITAGSQTTGLNLTSTYMGYWNGSAWTSFIKSDGDFTFGSASDATKRITWTGGNLTIRGSINADDITTGTLTGRTVRSTDGKAKLDDTGFTMSSYDSTGSTPTFSSVSALKMIYNSTTRYAALWSYHDTTNVFKYTFLDNISNNVIDSDNTVAIRANSASSIGGGTIGRAESWNDTLQGGKARVLQFAQRSDETSSTPFSELIVNASSTGHYARFGIGTIAQQKNYPGSTLSKGLEVTWNGSSFYGTMSFSDDLYIDHINDGTQINKTGATNGSRSDLIRLNIGSDGTLGPLYVIYGGVPSATGSSRYATIQAGDNLAYREIRLQPLGGNVGIGEAASEKLEVSGNVRAQGLYLDNWSSNAGQQYVCTDATSSTGFIYRSSATCGSSSIRYKENVEPLQTDWKQLLNVTPVTFNYIKGNGKREFGAIAEQLDQLGIKELVVYNETSGEVEAIDYAKMALYLLPIVKEQQEEINALKARLDNLEKRNKP